MSGNYNAKSCNHRLVWRLCSEIHPAGMHDYMKKKTIEDHDDAQVRESGQILSNLLQ